MALIDTLRAYKSAKQTHEQYEAEVARLREQLRLAVGLMDEAAKVRKQTFDLACADYRARVRSLDGFDIAVEVLDVARDTLEACRTAFDMSKPLHVGVGDVVITGRPQAGSAWHDDFIKEVSAATVGIPARF